MLTFSLQGVHELAFNAKLCEVTAKESKYNIPELVIVFILLKHNINSHIIKVYNILLF